MGFASLQDLNQTLEAGIFYQTGPLLIPAVNSGRGFTCNKELIGEHKTLKQRIEDYLIFNEEVLTYGLSHLNVFMAYAKLSMQPQSLQRIGGVCDCATKLYTRLGVSVTARPIFVQDWGCVKTLRSVDD